MNMNMKQNIIISIYQVLAITLCTYLITNYCDFSYPSSLVYIVGANLFLNIIVVIIGWEKIGNSPRSRQAEAIMMIVSSFTPIVSYYTLLDDHPDLLASSVSVISMFSLGQFIWVASIYLCPDIVSLVRIKNNDSKNQ